MTEGLNTARGERRTITAFFEDREDAQDAVERLIDDVARLLQRVAELPVQIDVVFDYQNAHRFAFFRCKSLEP